MFAQNEHSELVSDEDLALIRKSVETSKIEALPDLGNVINLVKNVDNPAYAQLKRKLLNQTIEQYKQIIPNVNPTLVNGIASLFSSAKEDESFAQDIKESCLNKLIESSKDYSSKVTNLQTELKQDLFANGLYGKLSSKLGLNREGFTKLFDELVEMIDIEHLTN